MNDSPHKQFCLSMAISSQIDGAVVSARERKVREIGEHLNIGWCDSRYYYQTARIYLFGLIAQNAGRRRGLFERSEGVI